jgi:ABC-type uncharacterized transport system substrate-binding protein
MKRRECISWLATGAIVWPLAARAAWGQDRETQRENQVKGGHHVPKTIVAVAIGDPANDKIITSATGLTGVRPYIPGLIQGLTNFQIGRDYEIVYRERAVANLGGAFTVNPAPTDPVIFCMSTTVVKAAQAFTTTIPVVGVVSDPGREGVASAQNICGVSAQRSQKSRDCLDNFLKTVPSLTEVRVLHKPGYNPSDEALQHIQHPPPPVTVVVVPIQTRADLDRELANLPTRNLSQPATIGVLVLPVDVCFGAAPTIIDVAQNQKHLPTFFPVTDWVKPALPSALGGSGVPQHKSGELMAERVDLIWTNHSIPNPRWRDAPGSASEWRVSRAAATALNITLPALPAGVII